MARSIDLFTRRSFLNSIAYGSVLLGASNLLADELMRTPKQMEGPFYPDKLPLDTDNDLIIVNDSITKAVGEITHLTGRILNDRGEPLRGSMVEIWQTDNNGAYLHSGSNNRKQADGNFQGFGRFFTGPSGEYYFRTIKPVPYPGRTPHIHFMVHRPDQDAFTTQCYIKGNPQNEKDFVFKSAGGPKQRDLVSADFIPLEGSKIGELTAKFDIVLGHTPSA